MDDAQDDYSQLENILFDVCIHFTAREWKTSRGQVILSTINVLRAPAPFTAIYPRISSLFFHFVASSLAKMTVILRTWFS